MVVDQTAHAMFANCEYTPWAARDHLFPRIGKLSFADMDGSGIEGSHDKMVSRKFRCSSSKRRMLFGQEAVGEGAKFASRPVVRLVPHKP